MVSSSCNWKYIFCQLKTMIYLFSIGRVKGPEIKPSSKRVKKLGKYYLFNPLPNGKLLDVTKLKAFTDDKLKVAKKMISRFDKVKNTEGKGENAG